MADRSIVLSGYVNAASVSVTDGQPIPDGQPVVVDLVGGSDSDLGDSKSTLYHLQWGTVGNFQTVVVFAMTGNTIELEPPIREFVGDGVKFFRVTRTNNSNSNKICPFWAKMRDSQ